MTGLAGPPASVTNDPSATSQRPLPVLGAGVFAAVPWLTASRHAIHFHCFKFGQIEPEVLCDERG